MLRFFVTCVFIFFVSVSSALTLPSKPDNYVNDYAHMLSGNTIALLNEKLKTFDKKTTNQIVVVTFPSLDGENLEEVTTRLEDRWKIGSKAHDNGVLLVIFKKEHKARIEVGYGLEGNLTDAMAGIIIREELTPYFRKGHYDAGVVVAINAIMQATQGAYKPEKQDDNVGAFILLFLTIYVIFVYFNRNNNGSGGGFWLGGGRSGGRGGSSGFGGGGGSSGGGGASGGW